METTKTYYEEITGKFIPTHNRLLEVVESNNEYDYPYYLLVRGVKYDFKKLATKEARKAYFNELDYYGFHHIETFKKGTIDFLTYYSKDEDESLIEMYDSINDIIYIFSYYEYELK